MRTIPDWWLWPLLLFLVPVALALVCNKVFRHRNGINTNWVLAFFVSICWITAIVVILIQVL